MMRSICLLLFLPLSGLIMSLCAQNAQLESEMGQWYLNQRLLIADLDQDQRLTLYEMSQYPREFGYYLIATGFQKSDLNGDFLLNFQELSKASLAEWQYRYAKDREALKRIYDEYPYAKNAKLKYLKRHPFLTQRLAQNFLWAQDHYHLLKKLLTESNWLRKHPEIVETLHHNFRWLASNPILATELYRIDGIQSYYPELSSWRRQHHAFIAKKPRLREQSYALKWDMEVQDPKQQAQAISPYQSSRSMSKAAQIRMIDSLSKVNRRLEVEIGRQQRQLQYLEQDKTQLLVDKDLLDERLGFYRGRYLARQDSQQLRLQAQTYQLLQLKQELDQSEAKRQQIEAYLRPQLDSLRAHNQRLSLQNKQQATRNHALKREYAGLTARLQDQQTSAARRIGELQRQLQIQKHLVQELALKTDSLQATPTLITSQLGPSIYQWDSLLAANQRLQQKLAAQPIPPTPNKAIEAYNAQVVANQLKQAQHIELLAAENQKLHEQIQELQDSQQGNLDVLSQQKNQLVRINAQQRSELTQLKKAYDELEQRYQHYIQLKSKPNTPEAQGANAQLSAYQKQIQQLELENSSMSEQIESNNGFLREILVEKDQLEANLLLKTGVITQLQTQVQQLQESQGIPDYFLDSLAYAQQDLEILNEKSQRQRLEIRKLSQQKKQDQEQIEQLRAEIEDMKKMNKVSSEQYDRFETNKTKLEAERSNIRVREQLVLQKEKVLAQKEREMAQQEQRYQLLEQKEKELKLLERKIRLMKSENP